MSTTGSKVEGHLLPVILYNNHVFCMVIHTIVSLITWRTVSFVC